MPIPFPIPKRLLVALLLTTGSSLALLTTGCSDGTPAVAQTSNRAATAPGESAAETMRVETIQVERRDLSQTVEMPGTVQGYETADLYAKVGGYLAEMYVDIGDEVTKGQELAKLWIPEMQKELEQKQALLQQARADAEQAAAAIQQSDAELKMTRAALDEAKSERAEKEAQLQFRRAELERIEGLVRSDSVTRKLLDESRFQYQAAEAALENVAARIRTAESKVAAAEANLTRARADHKSALARIDVAQANAEHTETMMQYATLRAPFDGYVAKRWVDPGAFIQPGTNGGSRPLLTVTRTDTVRIALDIPMRYAGLLNRGDRVVLDRINTLPEASFDGTVTRFSPSLNVQSRLMQVEIDLANSDGALRPGYYGYVNVFLEELPQTPVIPSSALLSDGDPTYVYVVEEGQCQKRTVDVCYKDGSIVGIGSGLNGGEQVVKSGGGQISDGQPVEAVLAEAR